MGQLRPCTNRIGNSSVPGTYSPFALMKDCDRVPDYRIRGNAPLRTTAGYLRDDRDTNGCLGGLVCSCLP